jgi:hypothetical protein
MPRRACRNDIHVESVLPEIRTVVLAVAGKPAHDVRYTLDSGEEWPLLDEGDLAALRNRDDVSLSVSELIDVSGDIFAAIEAAR